MGIASPIGQRERHGRAPSAPAVELTLDDLWEHHDYLHAVSWRIVGDAATAEDVVQETYMRALQHLHELDPGQSVRGWLATVARRVAIDEVRRKARHAVPVDEVPEHRAATSHEMVDALVHRETLDAAREALAGLGDRERRLLLRRVGDGRSIADLAAEEGSTVRAVESVLSRARAKLAAAVERGAAVFVPLHWLRRKLFEFGVRTERTDADVPEMAGRTGELVAAGTAIAVLAVSFIVGGADTPATSRVEMTGVDDAPLFAPMYGTEDADPAAALDRAAAPRSPETLAAAVADLLGISTPEDESDDHDPLDPQPSDDPRSSGAQPGETGWWKRHVGSGSGAGGSGDPEGPSDPGQGHPRTPPAKNNDDGGPSPDDSRLAPLLNGEGLATGNNSTAIDRRVKVEGGNLGQGERSNGGGSGLDSLPASAPVTIPDDPDPKDPDDGVDWPTCWASDNLLRQACQEVPPAPDSGGSAGGGDDEGGLPNVK